MAPNESGEGVPFYVGITTNPKSRLKDHRANRRRLKPGFNWKQYKFVYQLKKAGIRLSMKIIAEGLSKIDAEDMEEAEMKRLRSLGYQLTNIAKRGSKPQPRSSNSSNRSWREAFEASMRKLYGEDWKPKPKGRCMFGAFVDGRCLGTWPTMMEARKELTIGKNQSRDENGCLFGIEFKRTREEVFQDIESLKAIVLSHRTRNNFKWERCPVIATDADGNETKYSSIADAARCRGITSRCIRQSMERKPIRNRPLTAAGCQWRKAA